MSPKWRLLCLICGFTLLSIIFTACMSAEAHLEKGNAYFDSGQLEEAITEYSQAIKIDPEYALAYHHRGLSYEETGQLDSAIANYSQAIDLGIESGQIYYDRGIAYTKKEQWDEAIADYNKAISVGTKNAQIYYDRGIAYTKKEQWDEAARDYNWCLIVYPDDPCTIDANNALVECYYQWALSLVYDKQYDAAIEKLSIIVSEYKFRPIAVKAFEILDEYSAFDKGIKELQTGNYMFATLYLKAFISHYPKSIFISSANEALIECSCQQSQQVLLNQRAQYEERQNASIFLAKSCKANVNQLLLYLQKGETVLMYYPLLKIGDPTTIDELIEALNSFGYVSMAEDYLNCGNDDLENAALRWAEIRGYKVVTHPGGVTGPRWGSGL